MANEDPQQDSPTSEASAPEEEKDGSNSAPTAAPAEAGDDDVDAGNASESAPSGSNAAEGDAEDGANAEASDATGNASDESADAGEADASAEEPDAEDAEEQNAEEEGADTVAADDVPETDPSEAPENGEAEDAGEAAQQQHEQEAPAHRATVEDLLKAGAHYGHLTSRWHPKMKKHIFMERSGIHILDLMQTQVLLDEAADAARRFAARGKNILFIGTKKQAQDIMRDGAERTDQPHMVERWLGGTMTNFETIRRSIRRMEEIEKMDADGTLDKLKKKEKLVRLREHEKLEDTLGGIRQLARLPGAVFVVDIRREEIAVREANKLGIPVIAMVDTNCDPSRVEYPIPANDDALSSIELVTTAIADAIEEGSRERQAKQEEG